MRQYYYIIINSLFILALSINLVKKKKLDLLYGMLIPLECMIMSLNQIRVLVLIESAEMRCQNASFVVWMSLIYFMLYQSFTISNIKRVNRRLVQEFALMQKRVEGHGATGEECDGQ